MTFADTHHLPHRHPSERWTNASRAERPQDGPAGASAASHPVTSAHTAKTLGPSFRWGDVRTNETYPTTLHRQESNA